MGWLRSSLIEVSLGSPKNCVLIWLLILEWKIVITPNKPGVSFTRIALLKPSTNPCL